MIQQVAVMICDGCLRRLESFDVVTLARAAEVAGWAYDMPAERGSVVMMTGPHYCPACVK